MLFLIITGCAATNPQIKVTEKPAPVDINTAISRLSQQISSTMLEQNKRKIAVMNFPLLTREMTDLGIYLSEKLTNSLFQYRDKLDVVERKHLESIFKEINIGLIGVIDEKTAQSVGKMTGADAVVIGTVTDLGKELDINIRMIGTEKADVLATATAQLEKNDAVLKLLGDSTSTYEKDDRVKELKGLLLKTVVTGHGMANIALIIDAKKSESGVMPESVLYGLLKTDGAHIAFNLFKEETFKSRGFFDEIYNGNTQLLKRSDALSRIDGLILGRLDYLFQKRTGLDRDLISCNIRFGYKVINKNGDIVRSDSISVVGPGFSEDAALERGLEILSEKYSGRILKSSF